MNAKHTYTLEAGRCIMRDGLPFVTIHRCEIDGFPRVDPCDADDFARLCACAATLLCQRNELRDALKGLIAAAKWQGGVTYKIKGAEPEMEHARAAIVNCEKESKA